MNVAIFNDTRAAGHYGCDLVMHELIQQLAAPVLPKTMTSVWFHPVAADWRDDRDALPRHPEIDAVIVNGEGSIHHSQTRERAVYLPEIATFARDVLRVPAYLINATIQAIHEPVAEHLRHFEQIYVRESMSRDELAQWGIAATIVPDLTVQADLPQPSTQRQGVCGTDSVLVEPTRAIRSLCQQRDWPFRSMAWKHKKPEKLPQPPGSLAGVHEFAAFLASHELVVTGRFHTATFCLATRTPFVAVESNTDKISAMLMDVFGNTRRLCSDIDPDTFEPEPFAGWTRDEEEALHAYLQHAKAATRSMFTNICESIAALRSM